VKILDFGIAKLVERQDSDSTQRSVHTELGVVMGTVDYMSPEQARGLPVDERTDIWSLGVVLYEMLARRLPFAGATRMDSMVAILERDPFLLEGSITETLRSVVETCLQKDRDKRYQSIDELLADLKAARDVTGSQTSRFDVVRPHRTRNLVLLAAAWLLVVVAAAAFVYRAWPPAANPAPASQPAAAKTYMQMSDTEKITFIRDQEQRVSAMMGEHPVQLNDEAVRYIQRYVDRYVAMGREPGASGDSTIEAIYSRARSHVPLIARSFRQRKVPVIIGIYLPVVESAYRNCFENDFGAKGLYQFLPSTAKIYGVNPDEMCDVEKMTPAAAHYIADLMAELGEDSQSLTLVLVSYNRGAEAVRTSLRELRDSQDYQRNFWTLFANRDRLDETFRNESVGYVPAFFAVAIIGENPERFGLQGPPLSTLANDSAQASR
jgi:hypothetical protein